MKKKSDLKWLQVLEPSFNVLELGSGYHIFVCNVKCRAQVGHDIVVCVVNCNKLGTSTFLLIFLVIFVFLIVVSCYRGWY